MKPTYFIESVHYDESREIASIVLLDVFNYRYNNNLEFERDFLSMDVRARDLDEIGYFGFVRIGGFGIENANYSDVAEYYIEENNRLRSQLIEKIAIQAVESPMLDDVYSYHINVGHGNTSIVIDSKNKSVWIIDCSNYDFKSKVSYQHNVDKCIDHITKNHISVFHVDYMVLTHPHFDHYSGFEEMIKKGYIDNRTTVYINNYYAMPSPLYNRLLNQLNKIGCRFIEPIVGNSGANIKILYPESRVVETVKSRYASASSIISNNPNNASIVFQLMSKNRRFLFTGDIETNGWDLISTCIPHLCESNYIAISHHGSRNGHIRNACKFRNNINNVSNCFNGEKSILMGRTGAFSNMPHPAVLNDFNSIVSSEIDNAGKTAKFVELNWNTGVPTWY